MCAASLAEMFFSTYEHKYALGLSSGVMREVHEHAEKDDALIDEVKAHFTSYQLQRVSNVNIICNI